MEIKLKDGSIKEIDNAISCYDLALTISEGLARNMVCAKIDGILVDTRYIIEDDATVEFITLNDEEGMKVYRHTCSHVLAQAVKNIYPTVKLAIGPAIENGYYYDFEFKTPIVQEDFDKIEKEMNRIIKANLPLERQEVSKKDAIELFKGFGEEYKIELINELPTGTIISIYKQGDFIDLCAGPHMPTTGKLKAIKLTSLAGAYWKGNEKNKMLSRIYGTVFPKKSQLDEYLARLEEAKKRDHNKLGRELNIFMTDENIGKGLPLMMPKGAKILQILQRFVEDEEARRGYLLTKTPLFAKSNLYKISGHWGHYKEGMFIIGDEEKDEEVFALRPMTCPFQYTIYNNGLKSYRDLPCRYGETSTLFRNESSGEMHGLIRVRQFTISEGHIVCTPEQLEEEFRNCVDLIDYTLTAVGLRDDVSFRFSRWNPVECGKYIDKPEVWKTAEDTMKKILDNLGLDYIEAIGEAAFYGPKLDVQIKNVWGKEDTLSTIQVDMFLSENFNMNYVDINGDKQRPYIIHRTSLGCYERTLALLIEKYAGALPLWFAPEQVRVLSLTDRTANEAKSLVEQLSKLGVRCSSDNRSEKIGYKIREAQLEKVPYMVVLGDKEVENQVLAIRSRKDGDIGSMTYKDFEIKLLSEIANKVIF